MITKVTLEAFSRTGEALLDEHRLSLWPVQKKSIKLEPVFNIKSYLFRVVSEKELISASVVINKFEKKQLHFARKNKANFVYETEKLSAKQYLGFNLGLLELSIEDAYTSLPLTSINNKQSLISNKSMQYMYECVANSDFFSLYVSKYLLGNASSKEKNNAYKDRHLWLSILLAKEILKELERFIVGEVDFFSRIQNTSSIEKYSRHSVIEDKDISWLMENPNELFFSESDRCVSINGMNYGISDISQSVMNIDYDTFENRLLVSCITSIKSALVSLQQEHMGESFFPHNAISNLVKNVGDVRMHILSKINIDPPFNSRPEYSNKYIDDHRYINIFRLISEWFQFNDVAFGQQMRSPILGITEIFEHFVFIELVSSLKKIGFEEKKLNLKNEDVTEKVVLYKDDEEITIYYEPTIKGGNVLPLIGSNKSYYTPDYVIVYRNSTNERYGVFDAKFSNSDFVKKTLAPEIFNKYGLFLHQPNGQPLDFVCTVSPDINYKISYFDFRHHDVTNKVKPNLGMLTIPINATSETGLSDTVYSIISSE